MESALIFGENAHVIVADVKPAKLDQYARVKSTNACKFGEPWSFTGSNLLLWNCSEQDIARSWNEELHNTQ
jgi:hypothetical protein